MDQSEVYGNILDYEQKPQKNILVEAYHVAFTLPPILPLRYYLGKAITNENGKFRITFPTEAYGVIDKIRPPNIELRISDSFQKLYMQPIRFLVIQNSNNNFGDITIPDNFVYSDEIDHIDLMEVINTYLPDISGLDKDQVAAIIPEYVEVNERTSEYANEQNVTSEPIDYRGLIVPKRPKTTQHKPHKIPWYEEWSDEYDS